MNQTEYEKLKRSVSGFYHKFNTEVLKWHMNKMFNYEELLETAKNYETFEDFYNFHVNGKKDLINEHVDLMLNESKVPGTTVGLVRTCISVRLGNVYNGMYVENKIIETFKNLEPWIITEKTEKEIDTVYKVDGIVTVAGLDQIAIQIKPFSFTKYDNGSELPAHERFKIEYGAQVYYVLYKDRDTIIFNGNHLRLSDTRKIIEIILTLVNS